MIHSQYAGSERNPAIPNQSQFCGRPATFGPRPKTGMSVSDAAGILGVSETATAEEVQAAYLRLMRRAHPDSGGTSGLAQQLNAARETLLKKR